MDSELVYKGVTSNDKKADWRLSPVLADIRSIAALFVNVKFYCVKRKANMVADWVATRSRMGMSFVDLS
ncbi:putative ribonuclease H protein, partial [Corchorus olitorius]